MENNIENNNMLKEFYIPTYIFVPEAPLEQVSQIPSCPVIVFINTRSGGQLGHDLIVTYRKLLNHAQVFDLLEEAPEKVLHKLYGNMERLKRDGDTIAAEIHGRLRLIVAGGDGTAGWLLGVVSDLKLVHPPPVATVPMGTGNNLPYSFGWGKRNPGTDQKSVISFLQLVKEAREMNIDRQKTSHKVLQLAKDAKDKLRVAAEADKSTGTSADKRIADMKLAKDFAATMEEFRKLQNLAIQREVAYKAVVPQNAQSNYATDDRSDDSGKMPEQRALLAESKRQEVLQLDNEIVFNEAIIEEREQAIQEIQQQIGEVHEAFKDLATLVHAQGVIVEEVDTNIENSAVATKEAKTEIAKAAKTQKSNSSLLCLLMVIFGVVLLIVIIVLAS